jgi:AraC-like DNA-binding protein
VESALPRGLPARRLLTAAAATVALGQRARYLAASLHVSGRTLLRQTRQAGLPPPRRLLAWMRVLVAARLLDDPEETVVSAAERCGYTCASSLRRALESFTAMPPGRLRHSGAHATAMELFLEELSATAGEWRRASLPVGTPCRAAEKPWAAGHAARRGSERDPVPWDREARGIGAAAAKSQLHRQEQPFPSQEVGDVPTRAAVAAFCRGPRGPARRLR